jgi:hypothetical protein
MQLAARKGVCGMASCGCCQCTWDVTESNEKKVFQELPAVTYCLQVVCGTMGLPTCTVQLKGPDSITRVAVGVGTGEGSCLEPIAWRRGRSSVLLAADVRAMWCPCPHLTVLNAAVVSAACYSMAHLQSAVPLLGCSALPQVHVAQLARSSYSCSDCCAIVLCVGPVDAAYKAIDGLVRVDAELVDYSVNSVTEGIQVVWAGQEGAWHAPSLASVSALCCQGFPLPDASAGVCKLNIRLLVLMSVVLLRVARRRSPRRV